MRALYGVVRHLVLTVSFYIMLLWLGAMLLIGNVACMPLLLVPRHIREPFMQGRISATFRLFLAGCDVFGIMRFDLHALDQLNGRHGLVIVANHPSMIDVFLVISRVRGAICLMKASITANMFLAMGAYLAGYISNRRTDLMIRQAADAVREGGVLLVFPEGTRTIEQPVNALQPGVGLIAKRAKAPMQAIILETNSVYLAKGWPIWRPPPKFPMIYKARLGGCIKPSSSVPDTMRALQQHFESELHLSVDPSIQL